MPLEELVASAATATADPITARDHLVPRSPADEAFWSDAAPQRVRRANAAGDAETAWRKWQRHLEKRRCAAPLEKLASSNQSPLAWGATSLSLNDRCDRLLHWLRPSEIDRGATRRRAKHLAAAGQEWLGRAANEQPARGPLLFNGHDLNGNGAPHSNGHSHNPPLDGCQALEALAWAQLLIRRADLFERDLWLPIFTRLVRLTSQHEVAAEQDPLGYLLLAVELPLALAHGLPEIEQTAALRIAALAALPQAISDLLDSQGLPSLQHFPAFPAILASLLRCQFFACQLAGNHRNGEVDSKVQLAVRAAARLLRQDRSLLLAPAADDTRAEPFAWLDKNADRLALDKPTLQLARTTLGRSGLKARRKSTADRGFPSPAMHSESGKLAIMRPDWSRHAARLAIDYADKPIRIEFETGGEALLSGMWDFNLQADGTIIAPAGPWCDLCWVSDDDCDYLELEMPLADGMKIQRQILLARRDKALFLADAVLGEHLQTLSYSGRLPLARSVTVSAAAETRELLLEAGDRRAVALPLALNEWRCDPRGGSLQIADGRLELQVEGRARRLYAPLWIDLSRGRADEPLTWRQLTVAEQRENQPRDVAAGYRVQFGIRQWLVYRSLTPPANRTVLGMNLSTDFFLGRFHRDGETKTIVEVE